MKSDNPYFYPPFFKKEIGHRFDDTIMHMVDFIESVSNFRELNNPEKTRIVSCLFNDEDYNQLLRLYAASLLERDGYALGKDEFDELKEEVLNLAICMRHLTIREEQMRQEQQKIYRARSLLLDLQSRAQFRREVIFHSRLKKKEEEGDSPALTPKGDSHA